MRLVNRDNLTWGLVFGILLLPLVHLSLVFISTTASYAATDHSKANTKIILRKIKSDKTIRTWRDACRVDGGSLNLVDDNLTMSLPASVLNDLSAKFHGCRAEGGRYKQYFTETFLDDPELQVNDGQKSCVNAVFDRSERHFSRIADKLSNLFLKLNAVQFNPVDIDHYRTPDLPGWESAKTMQEIAIGDNGVAEINMDITPQVSEAGILIRQCFAPAMSAKQRAALGASLPVLPFREVD